MVQSNYQTANDLFDILLYKKYTKDSQKHLAFIILDNKACINNRFNII